MGARSQHILAAPVVNQPGWANTLDSTLGDERLTPEGEPMQDSQRVYPRGKLLSSVHLVGSLLLMKTGGPRLGSSLGAKLKEPEQPPCMDPTAARVIFWKIFGASAF